MSLAELDNLRKRLEEEEKIVLELVARLLGEPVSTGHSNIAIGLGATGHNNIAIGLGAYISDTKRRRQALDRLVVEEPRPLAGIGMLMMKM